MRTIRCTLHDEIHKIDTICQLSALRMIVSLILESSENIMQSFLEMFGNIDSFFQHKDMTLMKLYLEAMR